MTQEEWERRHEYLEGKDDMTKDFNELEWALEDEAHHDWEYVEDEYQNFRDDLKEDWEDSGLEYDPDNLWATFGRILVYCGPWLFFNILFQFWNITRNAVKDFMWAGGNWYLIFNTFISLF